MESRARLWGVYTFCRENQLRQKIIVRDTSLQTALVLEEVRYILLWSARLPKQIKDEVHFPIEGFDRSFRLFSPNMYRYREKSGKLLLMVGKRFSEIFHFLVPGSSFNVSDCEIKEY